MEQNLRQISNEQLVANLRILKTKEDTVLLEVLEHIHELERRQLYLKLGFPSLFSYLTQSLSYSESEAYRRVESARLMGSLPEIKSDIAAGRLTVTNMTEVRSAMRARKKASGRPVSKEERRQFVNAVLDCSKKEAQRNLAERVPEITANFEERRREHRDGSLELTVLLLPPQRQRLERARDLLAHKGPLYKAADTIDRLSEFYLNKKDLTQGFDPRLEASPHNKMFGQIPMSLRRAVFRRDRGRCQYISQDGRPCATTYQVEIDHVIPISAGGKNELANLRCLCRAHNQWKGDRIRPE